MPLGHKVLVTRRELHGVLDPSGVTADGGLKIYFLTKLCKIQKELNQHYNKK